jgi:hypothetical protein
MSKIKVNSIEAATGSTITIPSGQTLDISSTTLTLPSTVVTTTGTQTLTNKTIGVSQLSGTLPVANGGTGLTTLGSASQVLRVNSGATSLEFGTVATGANAGEVIQVVSTNKSDTFSMSSITFADITGLSVSITPASASNKILVLVSLGVTSGTSLNQQFFKILRDSTNILIPSSDGSRTLCNFAVQTNGDDKGLAAGYQILDTPNTTSSVTYKVQAASQATVNINTSNTNANASYTPRGTATITVMEIKG